MTSPDVAVVITTCDRQDAFPRALRSALAQTLHSIEVIVVDDASVVPVTVPPDPRIRILRQERPRGVSESRNLGLAAATARWVTFLDDDDVLTPDMLEVSLRGARRSSLPPPVCALSGIEITDGEGHVLSVRLPVTSELGRHFFLEDDLDGSFQTHNTLVAPTGLLRSIGGWDADIPAWEHDDLFLRLNAVASIQGIPRVTYRKSLHAGGHLSTRALSLAEGMRHTETKHRSTFRLHPERHAHYLRTMGTYELAGGRWLAAVAATSRSLRVAPFDRANLAAWLASLAGPRAAAWAHVIARHWRQRSSVGNGN
ncbi:MAG TPA: glycosyltransferase family A protein [Nitriliruptorales bacterium]|nr:glycosyltransferase family A protein [Nitriliruptorales bacterium]